MNKLRDMVWGGRDVEFQYYYNGNLWYITECGFEFPVPVTDAGTATFERTTTAKSLELYIGRQIKVVEREAFIAANPNKKYNYVVRIGMGEEFKTDDYTEAWEHIDKRQFGAIYHVGSETGADVSSMIPF